VKGQKIISQANGIWKQAEVAVFIFNRGDFKSKLVRRDKESHYILVKGITHQEDIMITNMYAPNICVPNFIK
jgi:hypothetical protein